MSIKERRVIIEASSHSQSTITFDPGVFIGTASLQYQVEEALSYPLSMDFAPVPESDPDYRSYKGWSRCTITISPPICQGPDEDCWNMIEHADEEETQVCLLCQEKADRAIADATTSRLEYAVKTDTVSKAEGGEG
jgi:hypothetical protein